MSPVPPPKPELASIVAALSGYYRRARTLLDAAAPVFSFPTLVVAVVLAVSVLFSILLQFGTPLFDARPGLADWHSGFNGSLAVALAILMLLRPSWHRAHVVVLAIAGCVLVSSLWCMTARLQYQRSLQGDSFYALPHQALRYESAAQTISLKTTDGVQLAATYLTHRRTRAIVIYPSWRTNRDAFSIVTLAQWLANGIDVLVLDPRGQGDSGGAKTPDGQEKYDVLAAVAYMRTSGHTRIGVLAEEDGALAAIQAATLKQGIDGLALVAPSLLWGESLGQEERLFDPKGLPGRFYWRVAAGLRLAPGLTAPRITEAIRFVAPTPVLLTGCKADPGGAIDQLHLNAGDPKSLIVLGGDGKPVNWSHFAEYYQQIEQWFALTLQAPEPKPEGATSP